MEQLLETLSKSDHLTTTIFATTHLTNLENYKHRQSWSTGQEQTELIFDTIKPAVQ